MLAPIMYSMTYFYKIVLRPINKVKSRPNILPTRGANLSRQAANLSRQHGTTYVLDLYSIVLVLNLMIYFVSY